MSGSRASPDAIEPRPCARADIGDRDEDLRGLLARVDVVALGRCDPPRDLDEDDEFGVPTQSARTMTTNGRMGAGGARWPGAARPPPGRSATLSLDGPIERADIPVFRERARALLEGSGADPVVCDLGRVGRADAVTVEALAWLQLDARRLGRRVVFRDACGGLRDLMAFVGLEEALPCEDP